MALGKSRQFRDTDLSLGYHSIRSLAMDENIIQATLDSWPDEKTKKEKGSGPYDSFTVAIPLVINEMENQPVTVTDGKGNQTTEIRSRPVQKRNLDFSKLEPTNDPKGLVYQAIKKFHPEFHNSKDL